MYNEILIRTIATVGMLPLFQFRYQDLPATKHRELTILFSEDEHQCIVFNDFELPKGTTYEIRADGVWSDINCEIQDEHWSFSLESFALRVPVDDYLAFLDEEDVLLIGDRIPFDYEVDVIYNNDGSWDLSGEILIEKKEIEIPELPIKFKIR